MRSYTPKGRVGLRLWSVNEPLCNPAQRAGISLNVLHVKGQPFLLSNGKFNASHAIRHYASSGDVGVDSPNEANNRIEELLATLNGTHLAWLIATDTVEAEIDVAVFHGDIDWEAGLDPKLIAAAHAARVKLIVVHYDKSDDQGAPLAIKI